MNKPPAQALAWSSNVPNAVTTVRIALAVAIAWLLYQGGSSGVLLAGILLCVAWATDGLDGFLARRLGQSSLFGALFDIAADRLIMTPAIVLSIIGGLWARTGDLMPFNPYPYAVLVIAGDLTLIAGVCSFLWKRRNQAIEFPPPTQIAKVTYSVQMLTLVIAVLGIGPDVLLAALMYLAIISTLLSFYSYLKEGGYVFTS